MNTCRKTYRIYAVAELIWKVGEKLEVKGMKATGGDHHFCVVNIQQVITGIALCKRVEMLEE